VFRFVNFLTIFDSLRAQAQRAPHAFALLAPGRRPLTFAALLSQLQHTVAQLLVFGVGRGDRVAVVVPNGPEQATALLGTLSGATCAPLDPGFTTAEFTNHLARLGARALIAAAGQETAMAAARALGIPVLTLVASLNAPAGSFTLQGELRPLSGPGGSVQTDDIALLLHTSGTTAHPKLVPLSHRHLLQSVANFQPVLELTPADRGLNVLPLFHIHGFNSGLMASLFAGASVVCTEGFSALHFMGWLREYQPTWYTASPPVHRAMLALAAENPAGVPRSLRYMRSGGASLPLAAIQALEEVFRVPVIEGYGMTEANPIACNPLPPRVRKLGSVGLSAGPEIGIMTPNGASLLPAGSVGEVVVRGSSVIAGYAGDPLANVESFTNGWLRTGDQGYVDADGYLFLTGRLKEQINRGGEKVAPAEVEAVLLAHPAVGQAVAFAMPEARLGEEVAAAVVLRPGAEAVDELSLRHFAAERLSDFKVPRRIVIVSELPTTLTGKVQRVGLAERLNIGALDRDELLPGYSAPVGVTETRLAEIWRQVLGRTRVGRTDRFLDLGGDSLLATQLVARVAEEFALDLSLIDFFDTPTIADQAALLALLLPRTSEPLDGSDAGTLISGSL
jgi:acyl-CoA synthetase (AMP-forming)/AMP-acid ligase II